MPRIYPLNLESADSRTEKLLMRVRNRFGIVPNLIGTLANSFVAANAYLAFSDALAGGLLSPRIREQIALLVAETNACRYCVSAHTALGQRAGLQDPETIAARSGRAADPKELAVLRVTRALVDQRGVISDAELAAAREAGISDGEMVEIVANVALNILTNYVNHVADTDIDFPLAPELLAA